MIKIKARFPCGMSYEFSFFSVFMSIFGYVYHTKKEPSMMSCPLHDYNCPKPRDKLI
jgi:hypothetical protein